MLIDWIHWLSSLHPEELPLLLVGFLFFDAPRFAASKVCLWLEDAAGQVWRLLRGRVVEPHFDYCPSMCVLLAGYNEAETIGATIESLLGSYPRLEIIVIDDGSEDGMAAESFPYSRKYDNVQVLSRPRRGGKSSAMNFALPYTQAEVIVNVDADSHLGPAALWEVAQPFKDPTVGAVSATILARNPFARLVTWLQAYEYLHSIFVGRMVSERLGILSIASGGFAATRREALERVGGWDVGPPEDLDLTMRVRKCGYKVAFAAYSQCFTDVPATWTGLYRQRIRWDEAAVVRNHFRKHIDMAFFWSPNFSWANFFVIIDAWLFSFFFAYAFFFYTVWICFDPPENLGHILVTFYGCALTLELTQTLVALYYSSDRTRDLLVCAVLPLAPVYQLCLLAIRVLANTRELFFRTSYRNNYVPEHIRESTWHW